MRKRASMPTYVLMKAFENVPARYDRAMDLLTLGRIGRLKDDVVGAVRGEGTRVLELGCGTGDLSSRLARKGARVLAVDASEAMLVTARERIVSAGLADRVELRRMSVMEIDALPQKSFDVVVTTLLLSELSEQEVDFVLGAARRLVAPGGRLLIGDEVEPPGRVRRIGFAILRYPLQLLTYLIGQAQSLPRAGVARTVLYFAAELPLMLVVFLVVPPTSRPLKGVERSIRRAGFRGTRVVDYFGGTLELVEAEAD